MTLGKVFDLAEPLLLRLQSRMTIFTQGSLAASSRLSSDAPIPREPGPQDLGQELQPLPGVTGPGDHARPTGREVTANSPSREPARFPPVQPRVGFTSVAQAAPPLVPCFDYDLFTVTVSRPAAQVMILRPPTETGF